MAVGDVVAVLVQGVIPDPAAEAPAGLKAKVGLALGLVKYVSLACAMGLFLATGAAAWAGEHGHGGGVSPRLKQNVVNASVALLVIGSAAAIVDFLMG